MRLLLHPWRLAVAGVRRRPAVSLMALVGVALAAAFWAIALAGYIRQRWPYPALSPALHHVELTHSPSPATVRARAAGNSAESRVVRTRVSFPEYTALSASGIPPRQAASFRSPLLISTKEGLREAFVSRPVAARFVNAPFFPLFEIPVVSGRAFDSAAEMGREPVVVLAQRISLALFGRDADPIGRTVLVDGRPFRVVAVARADRISTLPADAGVEAAADDLYLPLGWFRPLRARPETVVSQSPSGPSFEDLLASEALFISFWAELPTAASRAAFAHHLDQRFVSRGMSYVLRDYREWTRAFERPARREASILLLASLALLAAGFTAARVLSPASRPRRSAVALQLAPGLAGLVALVVAGGWWWPRRPPPNGLDDGGLVAVGFERPTPSFDESAGRQLAALAEEETLRRIRSVRYVTAVAPVRGGIFTRPVSLPAEVSTPAADARTSGWTVHTSPALADVLSVRVLEGAFPARLTEGEAGAITVITRCLRERLWPGQRSAVGRLIRSDDTVPARVVAVIEDAPLGGGRREDASCVMLRFDMSPEERQARYLVRTTPRWRQSVLVGLRAELGESGPDRRVTIEPLSR